MDLFGKKYKGSSKNTCSCGESIVTERWVDHSRRGQTSKVHRAGGAAVRRCPGCGRTL